ncbi:hypothetical protein ACTFIY_009448 [Dictyostelium cf. discoideum]
MLPIRNITINHSSNQIFITRCICIGNEIEKKKSIFGNEIEKHCLYLIPETINSDEIITVEDSVENDYGQIIGTFIEIDNRNKQQNKFIVLDVEEVNNICNVKPFSKGTILLNESEISSFILFDPKSNISGPETFKSNAKLIINNNTISREIFVTQCSKVNEASLGYIHHLIKGIEFNDLYTEPNLKLNIPIKVLTEFVWKPMFNIGDINNNTQESKESLTIITKDEKSINLVENIKCLKNYETKIIINSFETTYNRAVLIHPMGPNQISIYFKNNSKSLFTKSTIKLVNSYENYMNDLVDGEEKYQKFQQIGYFNCETQSLELLNSVRPNSTEISHQPLFSTRSKKTKIQRVKISKDIIFIDIEFKNKIKYQIVNSSQFKTKILIHCPNKEFKIEGISCKEINKDDRNLYLLDSDELSIKDLKLYSLKNEQVFAGSSFSNVISKFLEKKDFKNTSLDSRNFEMFNFTFMDKEFQKDLSKLLEKEYFEKRNSSKFGSSPTTTGKFGGSPTTTGKFGGSPTTSEFGNTPTTTTRIFGSASSNTPTTTTSIFGCASSNTPTTSAFGNTPTTTTRIFGSAYANTPTASAFGNTPTTTTKLFGSAYVNTPTATTSIFGSASVNTPTTSASSNTPTTTTNIFGSASVNTPTATTSLFGSESGNTPTTTTSLFGSSPTTTGKFGSSPTITTTVIFGSSTNTSAFVSTQTTGTKSAFGSSPPLLFGQTSPNITTESSLSTKTTFESTCSPFFEQDIKCLKTPTKPCFRKEEIKEESEDINEDLDQVKDYDEDQVEFYNEDKVKDSNDSDKVEDDDNDGSD